MDAHTIMANLKILFREQAKIEKHETRKAVLEKNGIVNPTSINVIEILTTISTTWVLDTGCCAHITLNFECARTKR